MNRWTHPTLTRREVTLAVNDAAPCLDPACSDSACQEVR